MEESIREAFGLGGSDVRAYSPLTLAFLGDAVFELVIRTMIVEKGNQPPKQLHLASSKLVKAETQSRMAELLLPEFTEEELAVYRRGRNAHPGTTAKHAATGDYRRATGLEALMGYLYLSGQEQRMIALIRQGWEML
ncbi:ribonuclease III [Cuneatibacter sp. NSJ-177]|uniref:Mini-ribonuclease 3 n=1 Tax=Cuneatibacter sp. NSJ-177 TaxID=2931401 RepID=UPI001FD06C9F|nr:ribonuclease III domain-containing protein [Cuneatibacter sp. NSJ-177]MCJ7836231.1 ribonuclease III [Cuneatibacter sp. NSJ-177]